MLPSEGKADDVGLDDKASGHEASNIDPADESDVVGSRLRTASLGYAGALKTDEADPTQRPSINTLTHSTPDKSKVQPTIES